MIKEIFGLLLVLVIVSMVGLMIIQGDMQSADAMNVLCNMTLKGNYSGLMIENGELSCLNLSGDWTEQ